MCHSFRMAQLTFLQPQMRTDTFVSKVIMKFKVSGAEAYESSLNIEYNGQNEAVALALSELMRYPPDVFDDTLYLYNTTSIRFDCGAIDQPVIWQCRFDTLLSRVSP
jgi:hypothetical protein